MKRGKLTLIICFLININIFGQNVYYDAVELVKIMESAGTKPNLPRSSDRVYQILENYLPAKSQNGQYALVDAGFDTNDPAKQDPNPFINISGIAKAGGGPTFSSIIGSSFSSVGGLDVTNIADGFAKFIVKRTKQELSIAFFEQFKKDLDDPKLADLRSVFPQTYKTLRAIGEEIYMYEIYIQTLRESFKKDITTLPTNLPSIIDNHKDYFLQNPEFEALLRTGFYFAQEIQNKQHPGNIIENYPIELLNPINQNVKASFQVLQLFSKSIKSNNDDAYWVSFDDIKKNINDEAFLNIYLGLILQQAKKQDINFIDVNGSFVSFADQMRKSYPNYNEYRSYLNSLAIKAQTVETKIRGLKKINSDSLLFENYYGVISSSIDLMRHTVLFDKLPIFKQYDLKLEEKTKLYFDFVQVASDIAIDVNRRNYSLAVVNSVQIFNMVFDTSKIADKKQKEKYVNISSKLFKYGSFIAVVAQAKSSDDVEAAIESIALPTGSARIKRESAFNVSLNAYCGLYSGHEEERFSLKHGNIFNSYGLTAPIGFAVSWGARKFLWMPCKRNGHFSHTIFLSVVDLGAITSFRFANDSTKTLSKVELKDIISPGVFYSIGIPKTPISVNLGYQVTPFLREVSASDNTFKTSYSRFSISICVDIPVLNFYTKPRN